MEFEISHRPGQALATARLDEGESVVAEAGAMVAMSPNVTLHTQSGGLMSGVKRLFGGESFFRNTFTADGGAGEVLLAQSLPGDQVVLETGSPGIFVQSASYVASTPNVDVETKLGGFRTFFSGEGLFVLRVSSKSRGKVLLGAFGGIEEIRCEGGLVVDSGHLVAWDETLRYSVGKSATGWVGSFLSGEGLACHFEGEGRVFVQSRNPAEFGRTLGALLPPRKA